MRLVFKLKKGFLVGFRFRYLRLRAFLSKLIDRGVSLNTTAHVDLEACGLKISLKLFLQYFLFFFTDKSADFLYCLNWTDFLRVFIAQNFFIIDCSQIIMIN